MAGTQHVPVLLAEVLEVLQPGPGRLLVDGTLGGGGHSAAMLERGARVVALDWDARVMARTQALQDEYGEQLVRVVEGYDRMGEVLRDRGVAEVDGVLLDLGFSSDQLDDPARGLSYHADGPLDMRLDSARRVTAADILNGESEAALAHLLWTYGEEPKSRVLAREIVARRKAVPWARTKQLLALVEEVYPPRHGLQRAHPAARIFQALRVAVNDEMGQIERALPVAAEALKVGGRLAVITFQPLEDRLVKAFFREVAQPELDSIGRQVRPAPYRAWKKMEPGKAELAVNPRARSAKLRVLERLA